ncbi:MAG: Ppx/GppA phosphatase family protein [Solirubrobacteraceae bacterium]
MRVACVDIGSNTTRLLVADCADGRLTELHQVRSFTEIGRAVSATGEIGTAKLAEVVAVVDEQVSIALAQGAAAVRIIATAAVRDAGDGTALAAAVTKRTGRAVEILSPEREARLAFTGAAGCAAGTEHAIDDGALGVVDVGGGSSELVVGRPPDRIAWWTSLPVGSSVLTDSCLLSDPPREPELRAARQSVDAALAGLEPPKPARAVAVGGSATSLARIAGRSLSRSALDGALSLLTASPADAVAARFTIDPKRARLLPAGLLILGASAELLGAPLAVGLGGIREGALLEIVALGREEDLV